MTKTEILIGCDPELFAFQKGTLSPLSVHEFIPGQKFSPFKVPRGAIQVDGVAAEFNIDPAKTRREFLINIRHVWSLLDRIVERERPGLELAAMPVAHFNKVYFDSLPPEVKELGCEPDYNAYTMSENPRPQTSESFRTGSGHIHVGWTQLATPFSGDHFKTCCELTKELDLGLLNASVFWDKDEKRRELYGQPGAFRPKPYGVEYRVLSNAWLRNEYSMKYVFDTTKAITARFLKGWKATEHYKDVGSFDGFCDFMKKHKLPDLRDYVAA